MPVVWQWSNGYLQEVIRNKYEFYSEDLICWASSKKQIQFSTKELYEKGEQNIQF